MATIPKQGVKVKSLKDMIAERTRVKFDFDDIILENATDGTVVLRYMLSEPIEQVNGAIYTDRASGKSVPLQAIDVQYVRMGPEAMEEIEKLKLEGKDPFTWTEEGKSGTFDTIDLKFDVSQRLEVWVVKTSLKNFGGNQRGNRVDNIAKQIEEFRTAQAMRKLKASEAGAGAAPESVGSKS